MLANGLASQEAWEGAEMVRQMALWDADTADAIVDAGGLWHLLKLLMQGTTHLEKALNVCSEYESPLDECVPLLS